MHLASDASRSLDHFEDQSQVTTLNLDSMDAELNTTKQLQVQATTPTFRPYFLSIVSIAQIVMFLVTLGKCIVP